MGMTPAIMGISQYTRVKLINSNNYLVDGDLTKLPEYKWCVEVFELPSELREWYFNWGWDCTLANFRDPEHALMFTLRWVK